MANDKKSADKAGDTAQRVSTSFFGIIDELMDDARKFVAKMAPLGAGALFLFPLFFTKAGRDVLEEGASYLKLKYGDQIAAKGHDWAVRAYNYTRTTILVMLSVLVVAGLLAIMQITSYTQIGERAPHMFWNVLLVSAIIMLGFGRLAPMVYAFGAAAGTLSSIKAFDQKILTSLPAFLATGGKTGIDWLDGWWRVINRTLWMYSLGAIWLALTPIHNDPAMKYVAGLLIPIIFYTHMSYKPGDRGPFWWWVNWATAFFVADLTLWCMFPVLKLVFNLGVTPEYLEMMAKTHPQFIQTYNWFGENDWFRVAATLISVVVLGFQFAWTFKLVRSAGQAKMAGQHPAYSSGGVIYTRAPALPNNNVGWIVTGLVLLGVVFMAFRHELFFRSNPMPAKIVQKELGLLDWWLPGVQLEPYRDANGVHRFKLDLLTSQPPVIEGNKRFPDTQAGIVRLGANPDSFMVVIDPQVGGGQTIGRAINRGEVFNYRFVDTSYGADSSGHTIRVPVDGWRYKGRTVNPNELTEMANHCLTLRANYGQVCLRVGEEGTPIGLDLPGGSLSRLMGGQSLAFAFNLMQLPDGLAQTSGKIRIIVWIDRTDKA